MWWASRRSQIVPFGPGVTIASVLSSTVPEALPVKKKRRLGNVWAMTEQK